MNFNDNLFNDLKKYCLPGKAWWIFSCVFLSVVAILYCLITSTIYGIVFIIILNYFIADYCYLRFKKIFDKNIENFNSKGTLKLVLMDFQKHNLIFNDEFIAGDYCIIGKKNGCIVAYTDLQAYWIETTYDENRTVQHLYVMYNNEKHKLCYAFPIEKHKNEYNSLYNYILSKNPYVRFCKNRREVNSIFK